MVGRGPHLASVLESCRNDRGGAVLVGPAGIGKTRLLDESLRVLEEEGWHVERFVASEPTRDIPFGPLISLLPEDGGDRTQLHASVRNRLRERSSGRPTVVAVDDAHLLDLPSTACIVDLVHHADVSVVLTARTDTVTSPEITRLWSSGALARIEVEPLDGREIRRLAEALLGGPIAPSLADDLIRLAEGNPLLLRELVHDARAMHAIAVRDDQWQRVGTLSTGTRLKELVAARLAHLEPAAVHLLELVALGEPLPVDLLVDDELGHLDELERLGHVQVDRAGGDWSARSEHPLSSEALRSAMPTRRRVEVLRDLSSRTVAARCPRRGDALRVVRWLRETGDGVDADLAVAAGHEALLTLDLDLAADLGHVAIAQRPFEGNLLLGEVRRLQARAVEAEQALALAAKLAVDDDDIVRIAMWRSTLAAHHTNEPLAAIRLLEEAAASVTDPTRALELTSEASFLAGLLGRFDEAVRTNRTILATPGIDDATSWTARINLIYAQTMLGRLDGVDHEVDVALAVADRVEAVRPEGVDLLWALIAGIAVQRGDLEPSEQQILRHIADCDDRGAIFGLTAAILVELLLVRGSPEVTAMAERALRDLDGSDPYAVRPIALAGATMANVAVGDLDAARRSFDAIPESAIDDVRAVAFIGRAHAALVGHDDRYAGARLAAESGRRSIERLHVSFGLLALYDAVLLGRPDLVIDAMGSGIADPSAPLLVAMCDHAVALADRDADRLEQVAGSFATMGARRLVAHAFADAARVEPDQVRARRHCARALDWSLATRPLLVPPPEVDRAVTERELEVALHAAAGLSSREIGERLYVSVRTVDNHLRRVYSKLDLSGRDELHLVLQPAPDRPR
jgi:DNA-binding CsgD family transcriptional regulator